MNIVKNGLFIATLFVASVASAGGIGDKLGSLFSDNQTASDEILDPEIAFQFFPEAYSDGQLVIRWQIEPGYYLYKDKLSVASRSSNIRFAELEKPTGKLKDDPVFGEVEIYYNDSIASTLYSVDGETPESIDLVVNFQGCKEDAVCYPPIEKAYTVSISNSAAPVSSGEKFASQPAVSEQDAITQALRDKSLLLNVLSFFGFGFLLALTPCVFPMIPILSGIIVGQGERITRSRALLLSVSYVLAMALTYALLGMLAGMFSINLQATAQNPWVLVTFSMIFVLLALSMFGYFELQLPASWQNRFLSNNHNTDSGTFKGAAVMGVLSAIIVGPCVAPPLAGALLYISQTGDALLGGLALFSMGLGFGVPLLAVGATSGELLPRAGVWMESIKRAFGIIMLGVAIWFLERIIPAPAALMLWASLFIVTAIFIGALDRIEIDTGSWQRFKKGFGLIFLVYGVVLIVAAASGNGTVLKPFNSIALSGSQDKQPLPFQYINNREDLSIALEQASKNDQHVMLDFYADWCVVCNELEEYTFPEPAVQSALKPVMLLKADVTDNSSEHQQLLDYYQLFGPPAILFFNPDKQEITSHRLVGFINAEDFVQHIEQALQL